MLISKSILNPAVMSILLVSNIVPATQKRNHRTFLSMFLPEDTSGYPTSGPIEIATQEKGYIFGVLKTMFWIVVSLIAALLIGQLH